MNKVVVGVSLSVEIVGRLKEEKRRTGVAVSQQIEDALLRRWFAPEAKEKKEEVAPREA